MSTIERDVVLMGIDGDGNTTIDLPITRLGNIEDTADVKETPAEGDYIPVMDSADNGQMKKISVSALLSGVKSIAESAQTAANTANTTAQAAQTTANTAASTAQAAQTAASTAASASTPTSFSVATSAWTALSTAYAGCGYSAEIAAEGVTAEDFPDVYFDGGSIEAASAAEIIAGTDSGKIILYAKSIPTATLSGAYFVKKGATA